MGTNERRRKTVKKPEKKPAQEVVYLAPKPFNRNRLLLHLATVAAVVIALVIGTGSVEYGSLVLAGSNVVDNAIVVDGKKYDVDFTNGISLKLSAAPDVEPVTVTIDSLTQTAESYSFVFDLDIKGGNGDYDCERELQHSAPPC